VFSKSDVIIHYIIISKILKKNNVNYFTDSDINMSNIIRSYIQYVAFEKIPNKINKGQLHIEDIVSECFDFISKETNIRLNREFKANFVIDNLDFRINLIQEKIESDFNDIISYFDRESKFFSKIFMTSFGVPTEKTSTKKQYQDLLSYLFPNL